MKSKRLLSVLLLLVVTSILLLGCTGKLEKEMQPEFGSIFVQVKDTREEAVSYSNVYTEPYTIEKETDESGSLLVEGLKEGVHIVHANKKGVGSGSETAYVKANQVSNVTINLTDPYSANSFAVNSPTENNDFYPGEDIKFEVEIIDKNTDFEDIEIEWKSNLDGILHTSALNAEGKAYFTTSNLSSGIHTITVNVNYPEQSNLISEFELYNKLIQPVNITNISKTMNSVKLKWEEASGDFNSYKVYRKNINSSDSELLVNIKDKTVTSYEDTTMELGARYEYYIATENTDLKVSKGQGENIQAGYYIETLTQVEKMIGDPTRPYIYAIDRVNNDLLFINTDTNKVEKTISVGSNPTDIDINLAGDKIYIANFGETEIAIVDIATQTKVDSIYVPSNPYRIEAAANNKIVYTEEDQWCDLYLIDATTGKELDMVSWYAYQPDIEMSNDGTSIYSAEAGISSGDIYRHDIIDGQLKGVDQYSGGDYSYPSRNLILSNDGSYLYYDSTKILSSNLSSQVASISSAIYALSNNGNYAFGAYYIYNADTFEKIKPLPLSSQKMVISADNSILYIYDEDTSNIYLYNLTDI